MVQRFDGKVFQGLSDDMLQAFDRDGVFVIDGLIEPRACTALMARMTDIVAAQNPDDLTSVFSTVTDEHEQDKYFIESASDIRFFLEQDALNGEGALKAPLRQSLNKVGHALHEQDPMFRAFSHQKKFSTILDGLLERPNIIQSMYIFKPAGIGGEVVCHQDSTYLWTEPQTCVGIWVAIEDATVENGCLWGLPGGHKEEAPRARFRKFGNSGTETIVLDDRTWSKDSCVPLEIAQGGVAVFHGQFPHLSSPNTSSKSREAYTLHAIDSVAKFPQDNWLSV